MDSFRSIANDAGDVGIYRGFAFYRKQFTLPVEAAGRKVFVEFEGARQAAYVYLNGTMVGYYEFGVTPFGFDLTKHVKFGEPNVLAVALDSTSSRGAEEFIHETRPGTEPGSNTGIPFLWNSRDFNPVFGGLTRHVRLYVKNSIYQTLPLYSNLKTKGTYVYATDIDVKAKSAVIHVEAEVRNETNQDRDLYIEAVLVDHEQQVITKFASPITNVAAAQDTDEEYLTVVPVDAYEENPAPTDISSRDSTVIKAEARVEGLRLWSRISPTCTSLFHLKAGDEVLDTRNHHRFPKARWGGRDGGVFINDKFYWLTGYAQELPMNGRQSELPRVAERV